MEIRPILSALLRNKTGPVLIALQIAITLAIVANSAFIIQQRVDKMNRDTGMDHENLIFAMSIGFGESYDQLPTMRDDLDALRSIPGVAGVSFMDRVPLSGGGNSTNFSATPQDAGGLNQSVNTYNADETAFETLGLKISEGRWFRAEEMEYREGENFLPASIVVTRAYANDLFPDESPINKQIYDGQGRSTRIIGVIEHMQGAWVNWSRLDRVLFFARYSDPPYLQYVIRTEPGQVDRLIPEIEAKLQEINRNRVVNSVRAHSDFIAFSYSRDSAMINMLTGVSVLLIAVTALGIVGLAAFNVNQRRKQIGTRRALGARRVDVLRYFMMESAVISTAGVVLGTILAFAMSWWLGTEFNLPQLDWRFVPPVVAGLLLIAQLAVLGPARRASRISPALATRSV